MPSDPAASAHADLAAETAPASHTGAGADASPQPAPRGVVRNSALMAVAALVSRITGLLAKIFIIGVLALGVINDSYTLANTLPNIVFELLIGGVLTSVAIPLLTRAAHNDADGGVAYTQQLVTVTGVGLLAATAVAVLSAPLLTALYLSADFQGDPQLATNLAYLLLPQIFFYGMSALFGAILNTKERFAAPAWAPVVNNLVVIAMAVALGLTAGGFNEVIGTGPNGPVYSNPTSTQFLILGLGTTAGIVAQALVLLPSLRKAGFRFRWRFGWDHRMSEAGGLALWAVLYVLVSQVGYAVFTRIASRVDGGLAQYYWASLLFQTPYGILGVSVLTAIMPRMSRHAAAGEMDQVKDDMSMANRLSAVALLPVSALLIALAGAVGVGTSLYGKVQLDDAIVVGLTCAALATGLLPLAMTLVQMRVFYALKDGRTPVWINAIMVAVRVPLLLASTLVPVDWRIPALAVATALSYLVGGIVGELWLRHRLGPMGSRRVLRTIAKMTVAAAAGGGAGWGAVRLIWPGYPSTLGQAFLQCLVGGVAGLAVIGVVALLLRVEELAPLVRRVRAVMGAGTGAPGTVPVKVDAPSSEPEAPTAATGPTIDQPATGEQVTHTVSADDPTGSTAGAAADSQAAGAADATHPSLSTVPAATAVVGSDPEGGSAADLAAGALIGGRYRLVSQVAVDTVGNRFWRAKDTVLPRDMALTLLPESPATNATVARTLQAGRLHHIGLPQTLDLGTERGYSYVVSQWVDGATLTDLLAAGPLDSEVAGSITAKIADAIAEAHRNGVSLGALHPSLVRVNFDGQVRLSHVISYQGAAPDQDIRAVGGLLYLMLTGTYPLVQEGAQPQLPQAPTRGGRELPADDVQPAASAALTALANRALHPDGAHGIHTSAAIVSLLQGSIELDPSLPSDSDDVVQLSPRQRAEKRLMMERRIKLLIAASMLVALTVLISIVVGSYLKRIVDSVQDPVITSDQRLDAPSTTLAPTDGLAASDAAATDGAAAGAATAAAAQLPVTITGGQVYDPQGDGDKDYTSYVDRAFDADPVSAWQTYVYNQNFGPDGLKLGVGLLLTLDHPVVPSSVVVATTTPGITVQIRTSDGNVNAPLDATTQLAISEVGTAPAAIAIAPTAPQSQYLIVFVTGLTGSGKTWEGSISGIVVNTAG